MCEQQGAGMNPQTLEQGLGLIRAILAGHGGDGLAPLPPMGQGAPGMGAGPPAATPPANASVGIPQPAGTVPSPALGLSFLAATGVAPDPTNMMPQPGPPGPQAGPGHQGLPVAANPPAGGISICLHLSPETVAGLMGAIMHLLGGGPQKPANPAPPVGHGGPAAPAPDGAGERRGRCPGV
jgi:hypothetical protein